MNKADEGERISKAKTKCRLLTRTIWRCQQLVVNGTEQQTPTYQKEFREDGKFMRYDNGRIVDGPHPWTLSDDGGEIIIDYGFTGSVGKIIELTRTRLVARWSTSHCTFVTSSEETMVPIENAERQENAV